MYGVRGEQRYAKGKVGEMYKGKDVTGPLAIYVFIMRDLKREKKWQPIYNRDNYNIKYWTFNTCLITDNERIGRRTYSFYEVPAFRKRRQVFHSSN